LLRSQLRSLNHSNAEQMDRSHTGPSCISIRYRAAVQARRNPPPAAQGTGLKGTQPPPGVLQKLPLKL